MPAFAKADDYIHESLLWNQLKNPTRSSLMAVRWMSSGVCVRELVVKLLPEVGNGKLSWVLR